MKNLEEAKKYFSKDHFAVDVTGISIDAVDDNYAKCSLKLSSKHYNAADQVMGGAIFTLADYTFAVATNSPDCHVVTSTSQITYLGTVKGDSLISESQVIKTGRTLYTMQINVTDNEGNKIAVVMVNGIKV
ncbi:MAG: PaaI family thioesterase [Treponema sp.]|uniref:PaaI family thioesterase n=1 Tax=Treponema sp. TaxID=166 RepID=UPI00298E11C9|nr:PaaI family thioesterase [Treponema sp.]MCQ2601075.1 PaaI family thioesterase [Treponema sp.]